MTALFAGTLLVPAAAGAQGRGYALAWVSTAQVYEGNLFAAPASRAPQADLVTHVGPALEVGYRSIPLEITAQVAIDAERYNRHVELNSALARHEADVGLSYRPKPRLALRLDGSYLVTQTPGEFNVESLLAAGRARAERAMASGVATYTWSGTSAVALDTTLMRESLAGGVTTVTREARIGFQRRTGARGAYGLAYRLRRIGFAGDAPGDTGVTFHLVAGAWTRAITPRTSLEIELGPQLVSGSIRPEVSAVLRRHLTAGELSAVYSRTQTTVFGERGIIDVQRVGVEGACSPARTITVTAAPSFARSARNGARADVYALDLAATIEMTRWLSLVTSGRVGQQVGTLGGRLETLPTRRIGVTLTIGAPPDTSTTRRAPRGLSPRAH